MEIDPFFTDIPAVHCPTCGERYLRPEDLEVHRERHRPVRKRETGSTNCPKGCKRWLLPDTPETLIHLTLCDGSPPLNGARLAMKAKWFCAEHNFGTNGPKPWGWHKKEYHGGQDPLRPRQKRPEEPVGKEAIEKAVELLKGEREKLALDNARIAREIERLDAAIKVLEKKSEPEDE